MTLPIRFRSHRAAAELDEPSNPSQLEVSGGLHQEAGGAALGDAMSIEEFHGLLGTLTSSDNAARQAAEATYNSTKEAQPNVVLTFLAQTIQCPDEGLRAFAAVLFRRSCPELWRNPAVDAATKTTIKQLLIETIRQVCTRCPIPLARVQAAGPSVRGPHRAQRGV